MNNEIIKKINKEIMNANVNITIKDFESIVRELQDKDKEIRELKKLTDGLEKEKELYENKTDFLIKVVENKKIEELKEENTKLKEEKEYLEDECFELEEENNKLTAELKELKEENRKNSGKINADWIKAGSKACSEALKFEESMDKLREFLESDTEKCDNGYITDYPNFQELIDKERLKYLESKKVEDLTLNDCIEECLIKLRLGQDKHKGELFEIDLTRYFCLLYGCREEQNYLTDSIMDEGYDEVLLNIEPVGIIGYGLKHKVTLKVRIPE
ncbi:hypothetical protein ACRTAF_002937 [Clostridium perfringens]|uniref:hypothetical protein n=1 Tax=Clostridium perfringens TaxID=1502 RepID=UPI00244700A8|nr:hypothetical protein [Clostridium perfringens]MDH2340577.1 hypothetical protein [Clostridium perfringens]